MSRAGEAGHWGRVGREREGLREIGMKGNVSFPGCGGEGKCYDEMFCDTQIYLKNWSLVVLVFTVRLLRKSEICATSLLHEERGVTSTPHTHTHTHTHTSSTVAPVQQTLWAVATV